MTKKDNELKKLIEFLTNPHLQERNNHQAVDEPVYTEANIPITNIHSYLNNKHL